MEYKNEKEIRNATNELKTITEKVNEFLRELYKNGNYSDKDVFSFIENSNNVFSTVQKLGYEEAKSFSIATQRQLLEQQADATAGHLRQLAASIFYDATLKYKDIAKACFINEGVFKIDEVKASELITKKFTYELNSDQLEFYNKLNNFCTVLNSLNNYTNKKQSLNLDVNISNYKFLKGGFHAVFRERSPYSVDIEAILKSNIK